MFVNTLDIKIFSFMKIGQDNYSSLRFMKAFCASNLIFLIANVTQFYRDNIDPWKLKSVFMNFVETYRLLRHFRKQCDKGITFNKNFQWNVERF